VFVSLRICQALEKKTNKQKQKFKFEILKPRKAVICLQCGKNRSQVREILGGKGEICEIV